MFGSNNVNNSLRGKNGDNHWILDTGATHHMTGRVELMRDIREIFLVFVKLPAGDTVPFSQQNNIFLTPNLCLKNVYIVPGFDINLISFGKLVTDNNLVRKITDQLLILQDLTLRMLIGVGDREGEGLYRFREIETMESNQTSVHEDPALWHQRLGHPSSRVLGHLPGVSNNRSSEFLHNNCDVCFQAKQTRQCFPDSFSNAKEVFDLIHCDLWGPYRTPAFCGSRYFLTIVDDWGSVVISSSRQNKCVSISTKFSYLGGTSI